MCNGKGFEQIGYGTPLCSKCNGKGEVKTMAKKLEIELFRYGTFVFGKVIHQDEYLRSEPKTIATNGKFTISSKDMPLLYSKELSIKGSDRNSDNTMFRREYNTEGEAIEACINIKELVNQINSNTTTQDISGIERVL